MIRSESNKLRGGYYTPSDASRFLAEWAIRSSEDRILEPSCGDGSVIAAAINRLAALGCSPDLAGNNVLGVELMESEARKAQSYGANIICNDFFTCCKNNLIGENYDAVIGNPPFIRYQDFKEEYREIAFDLMRSYGFSPNRLTNIWVPFLVISCHKLSDQGRLGMVIPAELFQVNYASETRSFLLRFFESITLITFRQLLFEGAQQEVILVLAEKTAKNGSCGIRVIEAENASSLDLYMNTNNLIDAPKCEPLPPSLKWQSYYLEPSTLDLIAQKIESPMMQKISSIGDVNVGLVSGQNSFFVIDDNAATKWRIRKSCKPIVSRSMQLSGLVYSDSDRIRQEKSGSKVLLFSPSSNLSQAEKNYIAEGERLGYNQNFKCRIRKPWYKLPSSWTADAFFYRQAGSYPRIVLNEARALNTDTLHKVRFNDNIKKDLAVICFNNSLTFAASELIGRSYGGGVLTFEPSEARNLPIPYDESFTLDLKYAETLARKGSIEDLLDYVDQNILIRQMGFKQDEVLCLRRAWKTLRDRRNNRKKR